MEMVHRKWLALRPIGMIEPHSGSRPVWTRNDELSIRRPSRRNIPRITFSDRDPILRGRRQMATVRSEKDARDARLAPAHEYDPAFVWRKSGPDSSRNRDWRTG